jgi:HK97 family phage portal protein
MSRATAKRRRQARKASQNINLVNSIDLLEPINISEAAFTRRMAKKQQQAASGGPQNLSMAWDDTSLGVGSTQTREGLLSEKERKDTYYKVFLGNQWVSGCVNVIAKRITSGGWECVEVDQGKGDPANKERIQDLLRFENLEEDFLQFLRSIATDILVFGEAYCELVWEGGAVVGLYMIDAVSMTTHFDKHGVVIKYTQTLERSTQTVDFEPDQIIRWWLPDPRAKKKALSPIEHLKDPVYLEQSMITWVEKFFKQGTRPNYSVELGPDTGVEDAQRYVKFFKENYTGIQNAHVPPVMYGGGKIVECGNGTIDIDFDKGQDKQRDRVLAVYGVPPAELNIIESGNLGGGTGESQNKAFMYNTVIPIEQIILEKFNYRVIQKGLGIYDYAIKTRSADYRDDQVISNIEDKAVRNGTLTINEARAERGRSPVEGGDEAVIIAGKDVTPVARFKDVAEEQAQSAQIALQMQQAQVDKAKQPPAPPPMPAIPPGQQSPDAQQQQGDGQQQPLDSKQNGASDAQQGPAKTSKKEPAQAAAKSTESRGFDESDASSRDTSEVYEGDKEEHYE